MKRVIMRILNSRLFAASGISLINYDLIKYMKHYAWVSHWRQIPPAKIRYRAPTQVQPDDVALCSRLIAAFQKATIDKARIESTTSIIWSEGVKRYCGKLISVLEKGDSQELARLLATMFREDFVYGLASGSLVSHARGPIGRKIWSMKYQDNIVALAEYLGVVRAESTQQGVIGYALAQGLDAVAAGIEKSIGCSIDFPDIGAPYGVIANGSLIMMEHPEHLYVGLRVYDAVKDYLPERKNSSLRVAEIGAGFGGLAYWIMTLKKLNVSSYTIIDLPLINVVQGYFLGRACGQKSVRFYGEEDSGALISVLPTFAFETVHGIDVLINENSMPEISEDIVRGYLVMAKARVTGIFFSYNHEAYSIVHGKPQVLVPEIIGQAGGFRRLSRVPSWVRTGYVEEIYGMKEDNP